MTPSRYLLFGAGQLGVMILARFFFQWVLKLADTPVAPGSAETLFLASSVGTTLFAFRIFDGVTDPVAGALSDGWVRAGRERRRLLWFAFLLPPAGLCLVFAPTGVMPPSLRWLLLAGGMFVFFVGYTVYAIPYWSLVDDYSGGDEATRTRLSNVLGGALMLATAVGFLVSPVAVERIGFFPSAVAFGIVASVLMVLPYYAAPEGGPRRSRPVEEASLLTSFRVAFAHRRFLAVLVLFAGSQMSFTVMTAASGYIAVDLLGGTPSDVALIMGPFLVTSLLGFNFVPALARRFGWERAALFASVALGVVYGGVGLMGRGTLLSPMHTTMLLFSLGGPMAAVLLGLEAEVITACAEAAGGEVTSIYFGVYNFIVKGMNGLAILLTGLLADQVRVHGAEAVRWMGFLAGGLLVVGVAGYLVGRPGRVPPEGLTSTGG